MPTPAAGHQVTHAALVRTPVEDGITLLDVRRGTLYHVNRPGAVILTTLTGITADGEAAVAAAAALMARYGIPAEQARADVAALLDRLRDCGLLAQAGRAR